MLTSVLSGEPFDISGTVASNRKLCMYNDWHMTNLSHGNASNLAAKHIQLKHYYTALDLASNI